MTLRKLIGQLSLNELKELTQEHSDWEKNQSIPLDAKLRKIAKQHYCGDSRLMIGARMERVANEAYRAIALQSLKEKPQPYALISVAERSYIIHTSRQDEIHLQEKISAVSVKFFESLSLARQFYFRNYDGGLDEEFAQPKGEK
jgi:hypothetical protein